MWLPVTLDLAASKCCLAVVVVVVVAVVVVVVVRDAPCVFVYDCGHEKCRSVNTCRTVNSLRLDWIVGYTADLCLCGPICLIRGSVALD